MIKEALEYIVGMRTPHIEEIYGEMYSDKNLNRISYNPKAESVRVSTLTSLIGYLKSKTDTMANKMLIQVVNPLEVRLISQLDDERIREELMVVKGNVPEFEYGRYLDHEAFLISLQSKFIPNDDRELLLKFAGTVENGTVANYGDDGISQKATIKKGIAGKEDCLIPNPVKLCPFRTFIEVEQPESSFVFRMRDNGKGGVECAIFEADGGAWKNTAVKIIKEYLEFELKDTDIFTVIS